MEFLYWIIYLIFSCMWISYEIDQITGRLKENFNKSQRISEIYMCMYIYAHIYIHAAFYVYTAFLCKTWT